MKMRVRRGWPFETFTWVIIALFSVMILIGVYNLVEETWKLMVSA